MKLTGDNLEYAISQYLDGTLSDLDRRVLEDQLAADAEARLLLEEHRHLKEVILRGSEIHLPINYDKLASHLSEQIDQEESFTTQPIRMQSAWVKRLAIAAGAALMVVVGYQFIPEKTKIVEKNLLPDNSQMLVTGPAIEKSNTTININISVGPTEQLKQNGMMMSLSDETFYTPAPKVVISGQHQKSSNSTDDRLY